MTLGLTRWQSFLAFEVRIKAQPMDLVYSLLVMIRAHEDCDDIETPKRSEFSGAAASAATSG